MRLFKSIQEILELAREIRKGQVELAEVYRTQAARLDDLELRVAMLEEHFA